MTFTKDISAKFAVAAVAVAMIFSAYAPAASAQTTEDLQQMINDLLAQVAGLQSQLGGDDSAGVASGICPYTWTRDLNVGSEGADVMKLQQFLNSNVDTRVAASGAGSVGAETMYYGPATAAAVSKMQVMYRAEILTPAGLVNPTGYFGPSSRAKANSLCVAAPVDGGDMGGDDMGGDDNGSDTGSMTLQGEGVIEVADMDVNDEEDELQEGVEDEVIAEIVVEAEDGDVEISRMTFAAVDASGTDNDDLWDNFEEFSVWVDGDKVAEFDASDEDEYLDENAGTFRITGLDIIVEEDEEVEILLAVSVQNSVDGAEATASGETDWTFSLEGMRYFDADGVAETLSSSDLSGLDTVTVDILEAGFEDGADLESNSDNPDSATLKVEDDSSESEEYTVFVFDIEVDEDSSDLELNEAYLAVTVTNDGSAAVAGQRDVISEIVMTIDGEEVDGDALATGDFNGGANDDNDSIALGGGTTTVHYEFDFDGLELDADTDYEVEVMMTFEGTDSDANYESGNVTIDIVAPGTIWELEGLESDNTLTGSDSSETHTLATVVPDISNVDTDVSEDDPNDSGTITFTFEVSSDDDDIVGFDVNDIINVLSSTAGTPVTPTIGLLNTGGDATETSAGVFDIDEGDQATFSLIYTYAVAAPAGDGTYIVNLESVLGVEVDLTSDSLSLSDDA